MTPERQRIAIAEWCGWKKGNCGWWEGPQGQETPHLPDYLNDLNAMHEAEKKLNEQEQTDYADNLFHLAPEDSVGEEIEGVAVNYASTFSILHCTATQRAEALLRTIGKWED